jgi:hypothetical protein
MTDQNLEVNVEELETDVVETEVEVAEEQIDENAQSSLKPGSTKSAMLGDLMKHVAGMSKQDLSSFLTKVLAQVGNEPTPSTHAQNVASIKQNGAGVPSPSAKAVKEDVEEMFAGQELSEEFKDQASTLFEAAVANRVAIEVARIEEEFESQLEEKVTESVDTLHNQVNEYMDYVVEQWMEQNEVAIENNYRVEVTESFIQGLKDLFEQNYVEVPEDKVDMVEELVNKVEEMEESLNSAQAENIRLSNSLSELEANGVFANVAEGLADTQTEKFRTLTEGVEYSTKEEYAAKLKMIKSQYFSESVEEAPSTSTGLITEEDSIASNDAPEEEAVVPVEMKAYVSAIARSIKK